MRECVNTEQSVVSSYTQETENIMQKIKRIIALIIVILWVALIIATLFCAIIPDETAHTLFVGLLYTDIGLPVVAYAMILITKILNRKK